VLYFKGDAIHDFVNDKVDCSGDFKGITTIKKMQATGWEYRGYYNFKKNYRFVLMHKGDKIGVASASESDEAVIYVFIGGGVLSEDSEFICHKLGSSNKDFKEPVTMDDLYAKGWKNEGFYKVFNVLAILMSKKDKISASFASEAVICRFPDGVSYDFKNDKDKVECAKIGNNNRDLKKIKITMKDLNAKGWKYKEPYTVNGYAWVIFEKIRKGK